VAGFWLSAFSCLQVLGQALISTILCVMPFLEQDLIDNLPSLVASSIVHMPSSLHGYIVQVLCSFLLPLTMGLLFRSIIDLFRQRKINPPDILFSFFIFSTRHSASRRRIQRDRAVRSRNYYGRSPVHDEYRSAIHLKSIENNS
jgi:hypothetical protein